MALKIISQDPKTLANLAGVTFSNCCDGVAVGANGTIITTNDGGSLGTSQTSGFAELFRHVAFAGEKHIVAVGDECKILRSSPLDTSVASINLDKFIRTSQRRKKYLPECRERESSTAPTKSSEPKGMSFAPDNIDPLFGLTSIPKDK